MVMMVIMTMTNGENHQDVDEYVVVDDNDNNNNEFYWRKMYSKNAIYRWVVVNVMNECLVK